jgi:predicted O-linked N-acetylglucosamine transferase (SPINDLY family)
LQSLVPNWRKISHLSDDAAAKLIFDDGIDILIDLSGHTGGNRLLVFARQPAPMQVTMFAYPNTTGLAQMHYRITDADSDPPGPRDSLYTEKLIRLPRIAWACMPPISSPGPAQAMPGAEPPFTFGCLNNPSKISTACAQTWSQILRACPESRLMLLARNDPEHEQRLRAGFSQFGIKPEQLWLAPQTSQAGYLAYHHAIDVMLDPFPYNGGVTTWDALWMGVPVLTLAGSTYVSRQGVSILKCAGMPECIAATEEEFIQKAIAWSKRGRRSDSARLALRNQIERSPLMNYEAYGNELSQVLVRLWEEHQGH